LTPTSLAALSVELAGLARSYLRERVTPHPLLRPCLTDAGVCLTGTVPLGAWDEASPLDIRLLVPDEEHARAARLLREAHLWDPARDFRLILDDQEPFRQFPGARLHLMSLSQVRQEFRFDLPVAVWTYRHAVEVQDPAGLLAATREEFEAEFGGALGNLRCEHYYRFRQARSDLLPRVTPRRQATVLAIKRGEAVRQALRLAFLAEALPYPPDPLLEVMAEHETQAGASILAGVRALVAAREPHTIERADKVLRDRVAFALQQGGVRESWLEQWWLWPAIAP
jgi:hypothetical protein